MGFWEFRELCGGVDVDGGGQLHPKVVTMQTVWPHTHTKRTLALLLSAFCFWLLLLLCLCFFLAHTFALFHSFGVVFPFSLLFGRQ